MGRAIKAVTDRLISSEERAIAAVVWAILAIGAIAIVVYITTNSLDDWTPNIATEAISIAITVGLVGWLLTRRERRITAPLRQKAFETIAREHQTLCECVALDYDESHPDAPDLPPNTLDVLDRWLADEDEIGATRPTGADGRPRLLNALAALSEVIVATRNSYPGALDAEMFEPLHEYERVVAGADAVWTWMMTSLTDVDRKSRSRFCLQSGIQVARDLGTFLQQQVPSSNYTQRLTVSDGRVVSGAMVMGRVSRAWDRAGLPL